MNIVKNKMLQTTNIIDLIKSNKVLVIKTVDLPEHLIMSYLDDLLIAQEFRYLNATVKRFINIPKILEYNCIVVNNRNIFNRDNKMKLVLKKNSVTYKNFEEKITETTDEIVYVKMGINNFVPIPHETKIIFIQNGSNVFVKKVEEILIKNQKLEIISINSLEIQNEIIFYKKQ